MSNAKFTIINALSPYGTIRAFLLFEFWNLEFSPYFIANLSLAA